MVKCRSIVWLSGLQSWIPQHIWSLQAPPGSPGSTYRRGGQIQEGVQWALCVRAQPGVLVCHGGTGVCLLMPRCLIWQSEQVEGRDFGLKREVTWDAARKLRRSLLLYQLFFGTIAHFNVSKAGPVSWCHMYSSSAFKLAGDCGHLIYDRRERSFMDGR